MLAWNRNVIIIIHQAFLFLFFLYPSFIILRLFDKFCPHYDSYRNWWRSPVHGCQYRWI